MHSPSAMNSLLDRITINPAICHGKPTIRGLRYPVDMLLDLLAAGATSEEILADYVDQLGDQRHRCPGNRHRLLGDEPAQNRGLGHAGGSGRNGGVIHGDAVS